MNLYLIKQEDNINPNTFDSMIVCAKTEEDARKIHPCRYPIEDWGKTFDCWALSPESVIVTLLGSADDLITENSIIHVSFNAGWE